MKTAADRQTVENIRQHLSTTAKMSAKTKIHPTTRTAADKIASSTLPARQIAELIEKECGVSTLHTLIKLSTENGLRWVEKLQRNAEQIERDFDRLHPNAVRPRPIRERKAGEQ
jgi:predicted RND superfamily exporter protein